MKKKKKLVKIIMVLIMIFYQLSPAATVLADELEEPIDNEEKVIVEGENDSEQLENNEKENESEEIGNPEEENNSEEIENPEEEQEIVVEENTLDDNFFNEMYVGEMYFENEYVFTDAKGYGNDSIPTIEELKNELPVDITLTVKNGEEQLITGEIQNNYELIFTDGNNEINYIVIVVGDNNSDNVFDESDFEALLSDYLEEKNVPSMDVIANDGEEIGTITFEDIAIFNDILNTHEDIIDNTDLNVLLESDASEVYVGDTVNFTLVINSSDLEDFIDGIEGEISNTNLELNEIKFNDNLLGTYNSVGKFVGVGKPLYNGDITITLVMTASAAGTGSVSITGNLAKYLSINEFNVNGEIIILEKEENNEEETVDEDSAVQETSQPVNTPVATPVAYYYYYSSNNNLKSLEIDDYGIEFDKNIHEYRIIVPSDVDSLDIKALAEHYGARVEITGNENFKIGENIVLITVTAEDGSTSIYKLIVDKKAPEKKTLGEIDDNSNTAEKVIIIVLIILVVLGLLYLIFKKDEEDENPVRKENNKVEKKEIKSEKNQSNRVNNNKNINKQNIKKKK